MKQILQKQQQEYYIEKKLKWFLDSVIKEDLAKKDKDYVLLVDGYEGAGKSTFAVQIAKYIDPTLSLDRVCLTAEEFKNAVINSKKNQAVIYDEAVTGMSSSDSLTRVGRLLKSLIMQMRQKNLFVIIIMPSIFEFGKYAVLSRGKGFFHVYELNGNRGYFVGYNRKDTRLTYLKGKKTHSYLVRSMFTGRFYGKFPVDEEAYKEKKSNALMKIETEEVGGRDRYKMRDNIIYILTQKGMSQTDISEALTKLGTPLTQHRISQILQKYP